MKTIALIFVSLLLALTSCVVHRKPTLTITAVTVDEKTGEKKTIIEKHYGRFPICTEPITKTPCRHITTKAER